MLNVSIGQNLWKRNRSIKIFLMEKHGICKGAKGSVVKAVRPGEHHHNVINFTKLEVYNIDVTNFDLDGVCDILYIQKVV